MAKVLAAVCYYKIVLLTRNVFIVHPHITHVNIADYVTEVCCEKLDLYSSETLVTFLTQGVLPTFVLIWLSNQCHRIDTVNIMHIDNHY